MREGLVTLKLAVGRMGGVNDIIEMAK